MFFFSYIECTLSSVSAFLLFFFLFLLRKLQCNHIWNDSRWTVFGMMISVFYICLYMCAAVVLQLIHTTLCHSHSPHTIRFVCVCVLILWINRLWYELMSLHKWETVCLCRSRTEKIMSSPSFSISLGGSRDSLELPDNTDGDYDAVRCQILFFLSQNS